MSKRNTPQRRHAILALLNEQGYATFARGLGIDAHVNPRQITVSKVLQEVARWR